MNIYSKDSDGGITHCWSFSTRYQAEKFLRDLRRAGRMTHWYIISSLDYDKAKRRYA
jgi:hypothetical protein